LEGLGDLNFQKLVNLLLKREKEILFRRAGYILELLKNHSPFYEHLNDHLLNRIAETVSKTPRYLVDEEKGPLNDRWNLYVPDDFEEKLRGI